jgi:hypothetical protein
MGKPASWCGTVTFLRWEEGAKVREEEGRRMAVEWVEEVSLRQLRQWQRAWRVRRC